MVFGEYNSDNDIISPLYFPKGFRLLTDVYIMYVEELVLVWVKKVATGKSCLERDYATCHTNSKNKSCLSGNFCDRNPLYIRPPNCPD